MRGETPTRLAGKAWLSLPSERNVSSRWRAETSQSSDGALKTGEMVGGVREPPGTSHFPLTTSVSQSVSQL